MLGDIKSTTDHRKIQQWIEERGGWPAAMKSIDLDRNERGDLVILFPGQQEGLTAQKVSWDKFFAEFDEAQLAFFYQE